MAQALWYHLGRLIVLLVSSLMLRMDIVWKCAIPGKPVIMVANHPSTSDPAFITTLLPQQTSILIKDVIFRVPLFGRSLRMAGHIPVVTGAGKQSLAEAERLLRAGRTIVIFPEGVISPLEGGFHKFHSGLARLALATGAPVLPVGISIDASCRQLIETQVEGERELGTWYFHGPYAMTVGEVMRFEGDCNDREAVHHVTEQVRRQVDVLYHESSCRLAQQAYRRASLPVRVVNFGLRLMLAA